MKTITSLNELAQKEPKDSSRPTTLDSTPTVSFVEDAPIVDQTNQLRLDVLKHIIGVIKTERDAAAAAASKKETKQKILEIIAKKQDDALSNKSVDELKAMLETV